MSEFHYIIEDGEVKNPYTPADGKELVFPPVHFGQDWEKFDPDTWDKTEMLDYTGQNETHSVYGIQLCELIDSGVFDWKSDLLKWEDAAYSAEQYERFCAYFVERFYFREIGITPFRVWANYLHRKLVFELMPKYKPLYAQIENGINPLGEDEYYKRRTISSAYPETQLSGNSDYITDGTDEEWERVKITDPSEKMRGYIADFVGVDQAMGDELEELFICIYSSYVNGL